MSIYRHTEAHSTEKLQTVKSKCRQASLYKCVFKVSRRGWKVNISRKETGKAHQCPLVSDVSLLLGISLFRSMSLKVLSTDNKSYSRLIFINNGGYLHTAGLGNWNLVCSTPKIWSYDVSTRQLSNQDIVEVVSKMV